MIVEEVNNEEFIESKFLIAVNKRRSHEVWCDIAIIGG
jgi:hypothetical protein